MKQKPTPTAMDSSSSAYTNNTIPSKNTAKKQRSSSSWNILHTMLLAIGLGCVVCATSSVWLLHHPTMKPLSSSSAASAKQEFRIERRQRHSKLQTTNNVKRPDPAVPTTKAVSRLAGLNCTKFGGPFTELAQSEMVYWRDIPSDQQFVSPFRKRKQKQQQAAGNQEQPRQYMTFEPDGGGWNNIRCVTKT
jgi:hypothetical protein